MNVYFMGMCIAMTAFSLIGIYISRRIKGAEDFYVANRQAPVILIAGSLIASFTSTGMFMGDAGMFYDGVFSPLILICGMQSSGYIIGAVLLGRYLRRSKLLTIPAFFAFRFNSKRLHILAAIIAVITMLVYSLSVLQGIGTLMSAVTSVDYDLCLILSMLVIMAIAILSGSRGVLITDTIMATIFTISLICSMLIVFNANDGLYSSVAAVTRIDSELFSWSGKIGDGATLGPLGYSSGIDNIIWAFINGIVWMSVCMTGPWQTSRYLMAKDEITTVKAGFIAVVVVFMLQFFVGLTALSVKAVNPAISPASNVLIWAAMNMLPLALGVILLTGILSAGLSSVTTFISLIGASVANDIFKCKEEKSINAGRIAMIISGVVVLGLGLLNSPSIFWIMYLGGSVVACSYMPVALAATLSKRVTEHGAFYGMLFGFIGCFAIRLYSNIFEVNLPIYLEPNIIGIMLNVCVLCLGSLLTSPTAAEKEARKMMFVTPEHEKANIPGILSATKKSALIGALIFIVLVICWIIPYWQAK